MIAEHILNYRLDSIAFAVVMLGIIAAAFEFLRRRHAYRVWWTGWGVTGLLLAVGFAVPEWTGREAGERMRGILEGIAPTYAQEFELMGHAAITLQTAPDDANYLELIEAEKRWVTINRDISDIYTMRRLADGSVVLLVDSETDYDADGVYAGEREARTPIGEPYAEVGQTMLDAFAGVASVDESPVTDRWGTWISMFVPLRDAAGNVEGILGVDYDARNWSISILRARAHAIAVIFTVGVMGLASFVVVVAVAGRRTAFFEAKAHSSFDGMLVVSTEGKKIFQNQRMIDLWRIPPEVADCPDDAAQVRHVIGRVKDPEKFIERVKYLYDHPAEIGRDEIWTVDGIVMDRYSAPVRGKNGEYYGRIWTFRDVTDRKMLEQKLFAAARTDKLTDLPNRALLLERLQETIERHKRLDGFHYAVLFLDFDRFKAVNDTLGHNAGDLLLREIAARLTSAVREVDVVGRATGGRPEDDSTVSRLGGDEFVVVLDLLRTPGDADIVAARILTVLNAPYFLDGHEVVSTASIGLVTSEYGHDRAEDVLRDADTAMYEAKSAGKGRVAVFDHAMRTRVLRRLELETGLRKAIDLGQFHVHYQPIVSLETSKVQGVEALVRWQHPEHGMVSPVEFIPIAEETGLIVPLGEWVFREACRQLAAWWETLGRDAVPSMSINLSRVQLSLPTLPEQLHRIALDAGVEPRCVHLEVTESAIMADAKQAVETLHGIKAMGFKIDMDDFGTGYSSLANLHQFPLDVLKIDRSFVANMLRGHEFAAVVKTINTLAQTLNINVVAEGVETADQKAMLCSLYCQSAQGYLFSRPLPPEQIPAYLRQAARSLRADPSAA